MSIRELLEHWRADAAKLHQYQAEAQAGVLERCVRDLEEALVAEAHEVLDVKTAAQETGSSESQLRRLFPGRRQIPRAMLPKKPGRPNEGPRLAQVIGHARRVS